MRTLTVLAALLVLAGAALPAGELRPGRCRVVNRSSVPVQVVLAEADCDPLGDGIVRYLAELSLEPGRAGFFETETAGRDLLGRRIRCWFVFGAEGGPEMGFDRDRDLRPDGSDRRGRHDRHPRTWRVVVHDEDVAD